MSHESPLPPDVLALGERVLLRLPLPEDEEAFCRLVAVNRAWLARWVTGQAATADPRGRAWFASTCTANAEGRSRKMLLQRLRDGALLGCLNMNEIVRGAFQSAYLGYWIGEAYARRGYMADGLRALLRHAFEDEGLHRLEANIQPGNEASLALVRAAGFRREGFSPRYLRIGDAWRDHERWALTVEDWRPR